MTVIASSRLRHPLALVACLAPAAARAQDIALPRDLSPVGMYLSADPLVKGVMIVLALASLVTWTVWIAKTFEIGLARRRERAELAALGEARTLGGAASRAQARSVVATMIAAALRLRQADEPFDSESLRLRLDRIVAGALRRAGRRVGVLATIGATAPFVGLFGTVWGIMNSFIGISHAQTTNLAVVAPGIAEALLATAAGLVAAIPAVAIYNLLARSIAEYRAILADSAAEVQQLGGREGNRAIISKAAE